MPFVAMVQSKLKNGRSDESPKLVSVRRMLDPRMELKGSLITCQVCGAEMYIRFSILQRAHFVHKRDAERQCIYDEYGGESPQHRAAKSAIIDNLQSRHEYKGASIREEVYLKDVNRIADVMVIHVDGCSEVHEAQLASCDYSEIDKRTKDYMAAGVGEVIWWLGGEANSEPNREWCRKNYGYVATMEIETEYHTVQLGAYTDDD